MNPLDLMKRLNGQILGHKIRATINGEIVVLAKLEGQDWQLTEKGQVLANEQSNVVVAEAVPVKTRKKFAAAVESVSEAVGLRVDIDVAKE
jgi:hypothetical protein